ncbi:hypothetical protein CS022_04560 [Veronia nyctiphanis]|uniref:DUF2523 domain-containing protein n=1 Tax=Veronia nyctiphanis TaxID=1278244 RepID=A0A4Q0YSU5_9GAMM|nr:DUF2523 family protein [Veronia nyctiphanis]RXJ74327.1 hypothetical protein CS022_04560 [Veronia nyctiphanis]
MMHVVLWFLAQAGVWLSRLVPFLSSMVVQLLVALGFSFTVVQGVSVGFEVFIDLMSAKISAIPSDMLGLIGLSGIGEAINAMLTAQVFLITYKGLKTNGKLVGGFTKKGS